MIYCHHHISVEPLQWQSLADDIRQVGPEKFPAQGGKLYGIWRSQIGRPRDELTVMTVWTDDGVSIATAEGVLLEGRVGVRACDSERMVATVRPESPEPPRRQGNYAFRWFETPPENWDEFLDLCAGAWPGFEASYDSQVIGLWRGPDAEDGSWRSLLMTRRPDLAMWERSKIPRGPEEAEVRRKLSRRYDLCTGTVVYTSTLLTAEDREDTERWT